VAGGVKRAAAGGANLARSGANLARRGEVGQRARAAAFNAAKEPLKSAASNEGARMGGHVAAYAMDALIPFRLAKGFVRPSVLMTGASFITAALTKRCHFFFRQQGQGMMHHVLATGLRALHDWLVSDGRIQGHDGMAGTESTGDMGKGPTDF